MDTPNDKTNNEPFESPLLRRGLGEVLCFGELLLRMSPKLDGEWISQSSMPVYIGGAELNVATALAKWGLPVKYCTVLPDNYLSADILTAIRNKNIDASSVRLSGDRIGTYYLPQGADLKHAGVIYDRSYSSFAGLKPGMIDWDEVMEGCGWFHFSAISPALNKDTAAVCREALEKAKEKGLIISVDLNYRSKLWQYGVEPVSVMPGLVEYCHIIMGNIWSVDSLLGIKSSITESQNRTQEELIAAAGKSMLALHERFKKATSFAYTFRLEEEYWAVLQHGPEMSVSKHLRIDEVIDKVGSGDCFMAGLIYGLYTSHATQDIIDFAAAAAVSKLQETGDSTNQRVADIRKRLEQKAI